MKNKLEEKELIVALNVKSIDIDKKLLTFDLNYPEYLKEATEETVNNLLKKLLVQSLGGDIEIKGLAIKWDE